METGKSNTTPPAVQQVIAGRSVDEIRSIGLCFEPNFVGIWVFGDKFGEQCLGHDRLPAPAAHEILPSLAHLLTIYGFIQTVEFTLIPTSVFEENDAFAHLALNTAITESQQVEFDHIPEAGITVLYHDSLGAQKTIDTHWPGLKLQHIAGHLIRMCARAVKGDEIQFFVYSSGHFYFVLAFKNKKLLICNALEALHSDDLVYYLLFAMKQFNAPQYTPTTLLGSAAVNQGLMDILKTYLSHTKVSIDPSHFNLPLNLSSTELSTNFIGHTGLLCA